MQRIFIGAAIAAVTLAHAPVASLSLAPPAAAQSAAEQTYKLGALTIATPWTRVTPKGAKVAGGYVRITNTGREADRLAGGAFDLSARVEVHEMAVEGGVMRMRQLANGLDIKPGETIELKPGGYHLMFMDMQGAMEPGKPVKGRLTFEKAGSIDIEFRVAPLGATSPDAKPRQGAHGSAGHTGH